MSMNDPLGDMLTRIRNGAQARKAVISCPWSKLHESVCKVLADEGCGAGVLLDKHATRRPPAQRLQPIGPAARE